MSFPLLLSKGFNGREGPPGIAPLLTDPHPPLSPRERGGSLWRQRLVFDCSGQSHPTENCLSLGQTALDLR